MCEGRRMCDDEDDDDNDNDYDDEDDVDDVWEEMCEREEDDEKDLDQSPDFAYDPPIVLRASYAKSRTDIGYVAGKQCAMRCDVCMKAAKVCGRDEERERGGGRGGGRDGGK
eukprot:3858289-Rhodomonas_salina.1